MCNHPNHIIITKQVEYCHACDSIFFIGREWKSSDESLLLEAVKQHQEDLSLLMDAIKKYEEGHVDFNWNMVRMCLSEFFDSSQSVRAIVDYIDG